MKEKNTQSGVRELCEVTGIAVLIGGAMTLLTLVPPVSLFYRWLNQRGRDSLWVGIVAGTISGVLNYRRVREKRKAEE